MKRDKYITFLDNHEGQDGYKYTQNVKYRIHKETLSMLYLMGNNGFINSFYKSKLKGRFKTGDIIVD